MPHPPPAPLVAPLDGRTSSLESKLFVQLGENGVLEAQPSVVHFGGFRLNELHTQTLYVLNKSTTSQRVHVVTPTTPYFRARVEKKGIVAPGMREKITIEFVPDGWRYFYDCIRLHCEAENLLVPLHAYPVMNDATVPRQVDFGTCPLSEPTTRTVPLRCNVPIAFEFSLTEVQSHPDFEVAPMRGVVPPNGEVLLRFTYTPASLATSTFVVSLLVAQFAFEPVLITATGCAQYGVKRAKALARMAATMAGPDEDAAELAASLDVRLEQSAQPPLRRRALDPAGDVVAATRERIAGASRRLRETRRATGEADSGDESDEPREEDVEGLRIPKALTAQHEVNFVLTQQTGKLKPKDLKKAIDAQRALRAKQEAEQEALRARTGTAANSARGAVPLAALLAYESREASKTTRQLKEMVFMQDFNALDRAEREREVQSHRNHFGEPLMPQREADLVVDLRQQTRYLQGRDERAHLRSLLFSEAAGPGHTPPVRVVADSDWASDHQPRFDVYTNNLWRMRKQVIARLREACTKVIVRMRADRRLQAIKARLSSCRTKAEVRELVERDFRNREAGEVAAPSAQAGGGAGELAAVTADRMTRVSFPLFEEGASKTRLPQPTQTVKGFQDLTFFRLHMPQEARLMDYEPMPFPATLSYVPLEAERQLRTGAHEESSLRCEKFVEPPDAAAAAAAAAAPLKKQARADDSDADESPRGGEQQSEEPQDGPQLADLTRAIVVAPPQQLVRGVRVAPRSLLLPAGDVRVFVQVPHRVETDRDYALRPRTLHRTVKETHGSALATTPGMASLVAFADYETISSQWRQPRQARFSALRSHARQHATWEVPGLPAVRHGYQGEDDLSDSESEDEGDTDVVVPTPALARALFLSDDERATRAAAAAASPRSQASAASLGSDGSESGDGAGDGESAAGGSPRVDDLDTGGETMSEIERDRKLLALEASKRERREHLAARLSTRLNAVNDLLANVRHKFVVSQPAHKPELPEPWAHLLLCPGQDGAQMPGGVGGGGGGGVGGESDDDE